MAFRRARPSIDGPNRGVRHHLRLAGAATVLVAVAVTVPTVASATPNTAIAPRIHSVQQRLSSLARENDQIVEKYNQADIAYHAKKKAAAKASAAYRRRAAAAHQGRAAARRRAPPPQYEGGTFSATGALLSSDSGSSYLDQLDTLSMLSQHNAQVVSSFAAIQEQAKLAKTQGRQPATRRRSRRAPR